MASNGDRRRPRRRLPRRPRLGDLGSHGGQDGVDQLAVGRIVVDDQHAAGRRQQRDAASPAAAPPPAAPPGGGDVEAEAGALARDADDADLAAHGLDQALADRQAQSRAAVLAGQAGVDLRKATEQQVDVFDRDARAGVGTEMLRRSWSAS
jgi:hypothetical protein